MSSDLLNEVKRIGAILVGLALIIKFMGVATEKDLHEVQRQLERAQHQLDVVISVYEAREQRNIFTWNDSTEAR